VTLNGISWNLSDAMIGSLATDRKNGQKAARVQNAGVVAMNADANMGLRSITLLYASFGANAATTGRVEFSGDGGQSWSEAGTFIASSTNLALFEATNLTATGNVRIRVVKTDGTSARYNLDDITLHGAAAASNQPPVLAAIGPKTVPADGALSFDVVAFDPADGDEITLSAENLPVGATFATAVGAGSVTNTFEWNPAGPTGAYEVVFSASDKDGVSTQTVAITVLPPGLASELILSEYGEGSAYNKYIELFNGTGAEVDLSGYSLRKSQDGANAFSNPLPLAGSLPQAGVFVVVHSRADPALLARADLSTSSSVMEFNGNDPVALFKGETLLDAVGVVGSSENWGRDQTLVRKSAVKAPAATYDPAEWIQLPQNEWSDVGRHAMDGVSEATNRPPVLAAIGARSAREGEPLQFEVSAADPVDGDLVILGASNLPSGAVFNTVSNLGAAASLFVWSNPTPDGVYTTRFYAADKDGLDWEDVRITVSAQGIAEQSVIAHFNELRYNDGGVDDLEFVELVAPAGTNLQGCFIRHFNGSDSQDGGIWTFTFPDFVVPDDGVTDSRGQPVGFVVLAQSGATVSGRDFDLPVDPASTNVPPACLQNGPDGLVLYDPASNVLDAIAWPAFGGTDTGDLLADDPGSALTRAGSPRQPNFLHVIPSATDDPSLQARDEVIGDPGGGWSTYSGELAATPGAINGGQTSGQIVITPPVRPQLRAMLMLVK
jgi:hypothetical protein